MVFCTIAAKSYPCGSMYVVSTSENDSNRRTKAPPNRFMNGFFLCDLAMRLSAGGWSAVFSPIAATESVAAVVQAAVV